MLKTIKLKKFSTLNSICIPQELIIFKKKFFFFINILNYNILNSYNIFINKINWFFQFVCINKCIPNYYYYTLDLFLYNINILQLNLNTYFNTNKLNIITKGNKKQSLSSIYKGNIWMERELSELHNFFFINLLDTRKLLQNYTINQKLIYKNNNLFIFNNSTFDFSINNI